MYSSRVSNSETEKDGGQGPRHPKMLFGCQCLDISNNVLEFNRKCRVTTLDSGLYGTPAGARALPFHGWAPRLARNTSQTLQELFIKGWILGDMYACSLHMAQNMFFDYCDFEGSGTRTRESRVKAGVLGLAYGTSGISGLGAWESLLCVRGNHYHVSVLKPKALHSQDLPHFYPGSCA